MKDIRNFSEPTLMFFNIETDQFVTLYIDNVSIIRRCENIRFKEVNYDVYTKIVTIEETDNEIKRHTYYSNKPFDDFLNELIQSSNIEHFALYHNRLESALPNNINLQKQIIAEEKEQLKVIANQSNDPVNHPNHYTWLKDQCGIEAIDLCRLFDFNIGNALKYILRAGHKKDAVISTKEKQIEDLRKAIWYLEDKIKQLEVKTSDE